MLRNTILKSLRSTAALRMPTVRNSIRLASTSSLLKTQQLRQPNQYINNIRINLISKRQYSAGPPPLTKEFVLERIVGLLESYDKVRTSFYFSIFFFFFGLVNC